MKRLIISLFVYTTVVFATTIHVPADSTTIQAGLNGASKATPCWLRQALIWRIFDGLKHPTLVLSVKVGKRLLLMEMERTGLFG